MEMSVVYFVIRFTHHIKNKNCDTRFLLVLAFVYVDQPIVVAAFVLFESM